MQTTGSHIINYNLSLPTSDKRERSIYVISDLLRKELDRIPEVREYSVMPGGDNGSMSGSATVDIKVFGYDMDVTNAVANDLKEKTGRPGGYARRAAFARRPASRTTTWSSTVTALPITA